MKKVMMIVTLFIMQSVIAEEIMEKRTVYFVVLAGGSGQRLWPLSRKERPKQLLSIGDNKTLLEQAIDRIELCADYEKKVWVTTTQNHEKNIRACAGNQVDHICVEPGARNTAPAILFTCLEIYQRDPDALVVFLPADPFIPEKDYPLFAQYLSSAINFVSAQDAIALLGVKPTYPATGYGYIEYIDQQIKKDLFKVKTFHEKPSLDVAQNYIKRESMLWNIAIFCSATSFLIEEFRRYAPDVYDAVCAARNAQALYDVVPSISIDFAVIEKSMATWVLPVDFDWYDVGNVGVFLSIKQEQGTLESNLIEINSANNLVDVPDRLVALVGVDNLCVVQTNDALLITKKDDAEQVKAVVNTLKQHQKNGYL